MNGNDSVPVRLVIWFVGVMGLIALTSSVVLSYWGKAAGGLEAVTTGCMTGLLALLGQTRAGHRVGDKPVEVTAEKPLPVMEVQPDVLKEEGAE